jgi:hypothetical protein
MKSIIQEIKTLPAPLHLVHIKKDEVHTHFSAAKRLAETALNLLRPAGPGNIALPQMQPFTMQPLGVEKVTADIPDDSGSNTVGFKAF